MLSSVRNRVSFRLRNQQMHREHHDAPSNQLQQGSKSPAAATTLLVASLYVLSGVTQPLLMTLAREAGLADPSCQLYMLFYYLGPSCVWFSLRKTSTLWPSQKALYKALLIACCDLVSQTVNFTGSSMAGPTLFAIIYSSVAVWTALLSRILLKRSLTVHQWLGVVIVFCGLAITGLDSITMGRNVWSGSCLVVGGSILNSLTYVLSESIMTTSKDSDTLSVQVNCAIQASVGCAVLLLWQVLHTRPRFALLIQQPMERVHTSTFEAACILVSFAVANLIHYLSFFYTLKYLSGGATSAGILKALQAVLVFAVTSLVYCHRVGGEEMCFSSTKLASLVVVVGGVLLFAKSTARVGSSAGTKVARRHYGKKESSEEGLHP